jgi:hypothetical protein
LNQARNLSILLTRSPATRDTPWLAHVLDLDIITGGTDPVDALRMAVEAVTLSVVAAIADGFDPFEPAEPAPAATWDRWRHVLQTGRPVPIADIERVSADIVQIATQLHLELQATTAATADLDDVEPLPIAWQDSTPALCA